MKELNQPFKFETLAKLVDYYFFHILDETPELSIEREIFKKDLYDKLMEGISKGGDGVDSSKEKMDSLVASTVDEEFNKSEGKGEKTQFLFLFFPFTFFGNRITTFTRET